MWVFSIPNRSTLDFPKGKDSIAELRRREGIAQSLCCSWSKEFLEAGKKRLAGDTARAASTSPAYVILKAADEFKDKTTAPNHLWQTDFTYLKVVGWGWFYLSTILDDYSRYIIAWKLCTMMKTTDVTDTLDVALQASGCDQAAVLHKPRLLSDNGSSYISGELAEWLEDQTMDHVRGAPYHPQTQGKIER